MRKILIAVMMLLALVLLSACTQTGDETTEPTTGTGDDGATNQAGESAATDDDNFNQTGFPIVNEPVTLQVTMERWDLFGDSFLENLWFDELEDRTNVIIDWNLVSGEAWQEQRVLLLVSGDLPDLFLGHGSINDGLVMANLHQFVDLNPLVREYMPNYRRALDIVPAMRQMTTYPDGGKYSFAHMLPGRPAALYQPMINMEWLGAILRVDFTLY